MEFVIRHRFTIWDGAILLAAASVLIFLGLEYDLLSADGIKHAQVAKIEFGEALLIAGILGVFLFVAVRRMRAQNREMKRRVAAERRARELASQDPLTGLANRRQFDVTVAKALAERPGDKRCHAVFLLDLNRFKFINDAFGHPVGDAVLQEISDRLASVVRESGDHVARLGGDEFGMVATHILGPEAASGIALRVIDSLRQPVMIDDIDHRVDVAIGIALFPRDGLDADEIIRRADVALYRAKLDSDSSYHFFATEMDVQIRERSFLERELRQAILDGSIQPRYQPFTELKTERVAGFELLAKWHHAELGEVPPERFLPVAESCGLAVQLGEHLLRIAACEVLRWPDDMILSYNTSLTQLRNQSFGLRVLSILAKTGLSPQRLEIEIAESALVRDTDTVHAALQGLRDAGVRIALDNFGTGYSSLYHLRMLKFDRIKIDRSFVASMSRDQESAAIIKALLGLGHGLGIKTVVEGVETPQQRKALIEEGCDQEQGVLPQALDAAGVASLLRGERAAEKIGISQSA